MSNVRGAKGPQGAKKFLTEEEKKNLPKITWKLVRRILSYMKPYWFQFSVVFAAILLSVGIGMLPILLLERITDTVQQLGRIISDPGAAAEADGLIRTLVWLLGAAVFTALLSQAISIIEKMINSWISQKIIYDMKSQMYGHLQKMDHAFFTTERQGDIITRMTSDIEGINTVISGTLTNIIRNLSTVVISLTLIITSAHWLLAVFSAMLLPLLVIPNKYVGKKKWELLRERQQKRDQLNAHINETLSVSGSQLVKIYTREEYEFDKFNQINAEVTRLAIKEQRTGKWFSAIIGALSHLSTPIVYSMGGVIMFFSRAPLSIGTMVKSMGLLEKLNKPAQDLLNIQVDLTRSLALFIRIFDYLDMQSKVVSKPGALSPDFSKCSIEFRGVGFEYSEQQPILSDVSFTVPSGDMYAIVGSSGAGKSTTVNLIPRLYDVTSGAVLINGTDLRDIDLQHLRRNIGIVSQETYLFNATIRENLLYADENASEQDLENACRAANIHDFIMSQPLRYETIVGNRGLKLSGGEKQRISIARVILKDPRILILDEATSSLDSISEQLIQNALEKVMLNRTCIVIAHRLSTILAADRILVLKEGRITEEGCHEDLLTNNGTYKELYETQFRKIIDIETETMKIS